MDFSIPEKMRPLLERIERFVEERIHPLERELAEKGFAEVEPAIHRLRAEVKSQGLWAPQLPRELGGMALSLTEHALVSAALGKSPLGHFTFGCHAPDAGNIEILYKYGTPEQRARWLEPLVAGEIRSCFSMTEPDNAGSNPTRLSTTAEKVGDEWVINGRKWFTSAADGAAFAIVMAVTDPSAPAHLRASQILVPTDTPGFRRVRNIPIMGSAGSGWASHSEIVYENCRVPAQNLLGAQGAGFVIAQERLGPGRIHHCMRWIGICERSFDLLCRRAATRKIDDQRTLADKQIVQAWVAECRARIDAARLLVLAAAHRADAEGFAAARDAISLIKFHVAEVMREVVDRAVQVHGALGITDDTVLGFFFSHERGAQIYDGPDEVHKIVVAKRILGRYAEGGR
jgi:acyl-CoA dehydrogenase